jgi:hypothetical protein
MLKAKKWLKENWDFLKKNLDWYGRIFVIIAFLIALLLWDVIITSVGMLESLVQAQATVLGLFGIIIAYFLNAYDLRLDRLEQESFFEERNGKKIESKEIEERYNEVRKHKFNVAKGFFVIGSLLVFSLLLSVIAFRLREISGWEPLKIGVSVADISFFFVGMFGILLILNKIGKQSKELKPNQS